jgi:hypothetical protein
VRAWIHDFKITTMSPAKPSDFSLLLEVFRDGLRYGVVSKEEVVAWADEIINMDDDPDYFFIDLSMQHDINALITALSTDFVYTKNPIPARVLFGLAYEKLNKQMISFNQALHLLYRITYSGNLSALEHAALYQIDDDREYLLYSGRDPEETDIVKSILNFFARYKVFNLNNFDKWQEINVRFEEILREENGGTYTMYRRDQEGW